MYVWLRQPNNGARMSAERVRNQLDADAIARDTLEFVRVMSETGTEGPGSEYFAALCERAGLAD